MLSNEKTAEAVSTQNPFLSCDARACLAAGVGSVTVVSAREQALLNALRAIVNETSDYPSVPPLSFDSYLPVELILTATKALEAYGVAA